VIVTAAGPARPSVGLLVERTGEPPWREPAGDASPDTSADAPAHDATAPPPTMQASARDGRAPDSFASPACRSSGPCSRDEECCEYCHDGDHCH
jgi:hypothetical protein